MVPQPVQEAVDAGNPEEVTRLLTPLPDGMSKSGQKKLIKQAQIVAKRLAQGKSAQPSVQAAASKKSEKPAAEAAAPAPPVSAAAGAGVVAGADEQAVIGDILAAMESLALPEETLRVLSEQRAALCHAIAPQINAMRNSAYAEGFTARCVP